MSKQHGADAPDLRIPVPRGPVPKMPGQEAGTAVKVTVDGADVAVPEGSTLLDACRRAGVDTRRSAISKPCPP